MPVNAGAVAGVNVERPQRAGAVNWPGRGPTTLRPVRPGVSSAAGTSIGQLRGRAHPRADYLL
jgi:hypothetical protein